MGKILVPARNNVFETGHHRRVIINPYRYGSPSATWLSAGIDNANSTSYSVAGLNIGNVADRQYVVAIVAARALGSNMTMSSITIGGVSATTIASYSGNDDAGGAATDAIYIVAAIVPTGTTATVAWTTSLSALRGGASVFTVKGVGSLTPQATATATDGVIATSTTQSVGPVCATAPALVFSAATLADASPGFDDFTTDSNLVIEGTICLLSGVELAGTTGTKTTTLTGHEITQIHMISTILS